MKKDHKVAILMVSYNSLSKLTSCLDSLSWLGQEPDIELFLYDNASSEDIESLVRNKYKWVNFLSGERNRGFSYGQNIAYEMACKMERSGDFKFDYVITLNPDTLLPKQIVYGLIEKFNQLEEQYDHKVGIIAPKIINDEGEIERSIHINPTAFSFFFKLFRIDLEYLINRRHYKGEDSAEVFSLSGACLLIKKDLIDKIGYFDTDYYFYYEDVDLCKRARDAGYMVVYEPKITITHSRGQSVATHEVKSWSREQTYLSSWVYFSKHKSGFEKILLKYGRIFEMKLRILIGYERDWAKRMLKKFKNEKI